MLYSASDIDILTAEQVANHPFLLRVGPDVLDMTLTAEQVKARLLSAKFRNRQFSGLLLDQAFLAGLGNYLRVEILWQVGLSGKRKAAELSDPIAMEDLKAKQRAMMLVVIHQTASTIGQPRDIEQRVRQRIQLTVAQFRSGG